MARRTGLTERVRTEVANSAAQRFWTTGDLEALGDQLQVGSALAQLAKKGELLRVRRGLYWRGRQSPFGMARPSTAHVVRRLVGERGVGPAGLSAANDLGLTTQVPAKDIVAVPRRVRTRLPQVSFVDRSARRGRIAAGLLPVEVALLKVLGDWENVVELDDDSARSRLIELVSSDDVRVDRLVRAAASEPTRVRERLSALLVAAGEQAATVTISSTAHTSR